MQADRNDTPDRICVRRTKALATQQVQEISAQPTAAGKADKRTQFGMKEDPNPLMQLSVDPFQ